MPTLIMDNRVNDLSDAWLADDELLVPAATWAKVSAPVSGKQAESGAGADSPPVNVSALCRELGRPLVHDESGQVFSAGASATERRAALDSLHAPDFVLPDLDGTPRALSEFRGQRVFLTTWSSW